MQNSFVNEFITKLNGKLSVEDLKLVSQELHIFANDYDIESKCTELTEYSDIIPRCYQVYMVSKKIEGLSTESLKTYDYYLRDFFININKPLSDIQSNDIRVYLYDLQKRRNITNRSLDGRRLVINTFLEWCAQEDYIISNPCKKISPIKFESKLREPLNGVELEMVRDTCSTYREKAMVELFYSTGCRVSEMVRLNKSDLDFSTGEVYLFGKGNKHRTSYLNAKAEVAIKKYLFTRKESTESGDALFLSERKPYKRLSKGGIERIISQIGQKSEIGRNLYPHLIRHTMASDSINRGMSVAEIKEILGHEKIDTTMIYAKVSNESVKHNHKKYIV